MSGSHSTSTTTAPPATRTTTKDVPDSFRIIRDSTGVNIVDRDFCADLRLFTT